MFGSALRDISRLRVLAAGEVLWDIFGEEKHLGGAPFNFLYCCHALGARTKMLSRVGADDLGDEILRRAGRLGIETDLMQTDAAHATGTVNVLLDAHGIPTYDIKREVAYDFIEEHDDADAWAATADVYYLGTLAQRKAISRRAVQGLAEHTGEDCLVVYDVNLRPPHFDCDVIRQNLEHATVFKLNEEELAELRYVLRLPATEGDAVAELMARFELSTIVLTRGSRGASAWHDGESASFHGVPVKVKDTVGSGDAFIAVFSTQLAAGASLSEALSWANRAGAYLASQSGATPPLTPELLQQFAADAKDGVVNRPQHP